jgi:hypothetical protein
MPNNRNQRRGAAVLLEVLRSEGTRYEATEISQKLHAYDAIFALGGKSLITILYTEGSAVPPGMQIFQLSADARDLGSHLFNKAGPRGRHQGVTPRALAASDSHDCR